MRRFFEQFYNYHNFDLSLKSRRYTWYSASLIFVALILIITLGNNHKNSTKAQEEKIIKIFPTSIQVQGQWQGGNNILQQDKKEDDDLNAFSPSDSAIIIWDKLETIVTTTTTLPVPSGGGNVNDTTSTSNTLNSTTTTVLTSTTSTTNTTLPTEPTTTTIVETTSTSSVPETTTTLPEETTTTIATVPPTTIPLTTVTTLSANYYFNDFNIGKSIKSFLSLLGLTEKAIAEEIPPTTTIETTSSSSTSTTTETVPTTTIFIDTTTTTLLLTSTTVTSLGEVVDTTTVVTNLPENASTSSTTLTVQKKEFLVPPVVIESPVDFIELSSFSVSGQKWGNKKPKLLQLRLSYAAFNFKEADLQVDYYFDQKWQNSSVTRLNQDEISNATNKGYFLYALPLISQWQDLENLKIRISLNNPNKTGRIYLDSVWLEVIYQEKNFGVHNTFSLNTEPVFILEPSQTDLELTGAGIDIASDIKVNNSQGLTIKEVKFFDAQGSPKKADIELTLNEGQPQIKLNHSFKTKPGRYHLRAVVNIEGQDYLVDQDFMWGVMAINFNKASYQIGETSYIQMASLDENGNTQCDSNLKLDIISPEGLTTTIPVEKSVSCGPNNVTSLPDYYAYTTLTISGEYQFILTNLDNGYVINENLKVDENTPLFIVERLGATRIYPVSNYNFLIKITPQSDFNGTLEEKIPEGFQITNLTNENNFSSFSILPGESCSSTLEWKVNWLAEQTYEILYSFDAPNISPYLYLLGPLSFKNTEGTVLYSENRSWQIASDVVANLIMLWDSATLDAPTGWTCISCSSGDPFYQRFIRGATSYGSAAGGSIDHTHTLGFAVGTSSLVIGNTSNGKQYPPLPNHTHSISVSSGNDGSNIPLYRNLKVIKYNYGIPATLPAGIIAIFDGTQPSGWTALDNDSRYIRGENTANVNVAGGTTGNAHTHTITLTSPSGTAGTQTSTKNASGGTTAAKDHTHTITNTGTSDSKDIQPPYMTVVLAKKDSSGSIPTNMIGMFDNSLPTGWTAKSASSGDPFFNRFFKPTGTYGASSDVSTHTHANLNIVTNGSTTTMAYGGTTGTTFANTNHTHTITVSFGSAVDHQPPYWDVIFGKSSSSPTSNLTQSHYHWRNDDNNESTATSATGGTEDTSLNISLSDNKRLRIDMANKGTAAKEGVTLRLDYGIKSTANCSDITTWYDVGAASGDWDMYDSTYITADGANTTNIAVSTGGVTDNNTSWITANTAVKDTSSTVGSLNFNYENFIEAEFSIKPNASATGDYCFRLSNAGSITDFTYSKFAEASIAHLPMVSDVKLNNQTNIDLVESSTKSVSATATVTDSAGCSTISTVEAKIYRSGVTDGSTCTADDNNCYAVASCTQDGSSCTGAGDNDATYTCTINMQFFAEPTDTVTPWSSEYWKAWIKATDSSSSFHSALNTDGAPEVNSLLALTVTSTINYGNFDPGSSSTTLDQQTVVTSTGNVSLDTNVYGVAMTSGSNSIAVGQQRYSLNSGTAFASGTQLLVSPGVDADTNICKNTSTTKETKDMWWGIAIPDPQPTGTYSGTNTFSAVKNTWTNPGDWCEISQLAVGDDYEGGKVAYILQSGDPGYDAGVQHGLIAASSDQSTSIYWHVTHDGVTGATGTVLGTGNANTDAIVALYGAESNAGRLCYDLSLNTYTDWYLPSKDELNKLYLNQAAIEGFTSNYYWSSSEINAINAWIQHMGIGYQGDGDKAYLQKARCVRDF